MDEKLCFVDEHELKTAKDECIEWIRTYGSSI
jgi:hypothetical protein